MPPQPGGPPLSVVGTSHDGRKTTTAVARQDDVEKVVENRPHAVVRHDSHSNFRRSETSLESQPDTFERHAKPLANRNEAIPRRVGQHSFLQFAADALDRVGTTFEIRRQKRDQAQVSFALLLQRLPQRNEVALLLHEIQNQNVHLRLEVVLLHLVARRSSSSDRHPVSHPFQNLGCKYRGCCSSSGSCKCRYRQNEHFLLLLLLLLTFSLSFETLNQKKKQDQNETKKIHFTFSLSLLYTFLKSATKDNHL